MTKRYLLIFGLLISPMQVHALYLGNTGYNLNETRPEVNGSSYYKCSNSVTFSCQTTAISVSYTSRSGGNGTSVSPYVINGCSFNGCVWI